MSSLRLFTSNRMETLADALAWVLRTPFTSALAAETVIVQSRGMERWVSMALAERHGICANIRFPFPNAYAAEILQKAFPDLPDKSLFDPEIMTWKVMKLLPALIKRPGFEPLLVYLEQTGSGLKCFQLSERIADLFDQYLLFRPEMVLKWEKGQIGHWQAVLWRELVKGHESEHRAALGKALIKRLLTSRVPLDDLPERISIFGISTLPRFHIQVFAALSRFTQVNLFLLNPCREYWAHIASDRDMERIMGKEKLAAVSKEDLHLEKGNPLLASMGKLGADFFDLINEFECEEKESFEDPGGHTLLTRIQSDILNLEAPGFEERGSGPPKRSEISEVDESIQIHSCHSPMREVEVLKDNLLRMFENDQDLNPRDILVMTPDIEVYAPFIRAVFEGPGHDPTNIPFSVADQSVRAEGKIIEPFLAVMRLVDGRFTAFEVMSLLESPAVLRRFNLLEADMALIRRWVEDTGIRWGKDGADRLAMGLPALPENTWKAGLDRLLSGYAMAGRGERMFMGTLPFDDMEGSDTLVLGRFLEFMDRLLGFVKTLGRSRTPSEWSLFLKEMFEALFLPDETTALEARIIQATLYHLADEDIRSDFGEKVDPDVIRYHLEQRLKKEGFGFGFITGGVTFCAMLPMRSIPFKVICLLGLNNDAYPRQSKTLGFDLMAKVPKKGDRSRRNDDRYLFLEAILSARKTLYISHVGQSLLDNTPISPSVLVSELLDYIAQGYQLKRGKIRVHVVTQHRLHPFNPEYFKSSQTFFSYSREHFETARRLTGPRKASLPFISKGLFAPDEEWKTIDMDDLCRFFENPVKFLLQRRLDIYLDETPELIQETEPFVLSGLDHYLLAQDLLKKRLSGGDLQDFFLVTRAGGRLPHGVVGEITYESLRQGVEGFFESMEPYIRGETLEPLDVDLKVNGFHLTGSIRDIYQERLLRYRYARIKPEDMIRGWVYHLVLNCIKPEGYPQTSMVAGQDKAWTALEYPPLENAEPLLTGLLKHYWTGLVLPIHFFPDASWQYARLVIERERPVGGALEKARHAWQGSDFKRGEKEDPYYRLCFGRSDPIDAAFEEISLDVLGPLIGNKREVGF